MKHVVIVAVVLLGSSYSVRAAAQSRTVVGTVREAWTDRPIANAEVSILGEEGWVCTNDRGEYRLATRTGSVGVIARFGEAIGRPRTLAPTDTVAALDVDPRFKVVTPSNSNQPGFYSIGGAPVGLLAAPEIYTVRGRYYIDGVELAVRPSHCGPSTPSRRGAGQS